MPSCANASDNGLPVVMNCQSWLPLTQNWIHTQTSFLPEWVTPHIVCFEEDNAPAFPQKHLHCYQSLPAVKRLHVLMASLLRVGYRTGRHKALLHHIIRREAITAVHSHFGNVAHAFAPFLHRLKIPHVVTFYGADMSHLPQTNPVWRRRYSHMFPLVDRVLCEGPHMLNRVEALGCPKEKLALHRLGVDLEMLPFRLRQWRKEQPFRVLIASSFKEKKGIPYALRALATLPGHVDLRLTIIGDSDGSSRSSAEKSHILRVLAETGLSSRTRLLGFLPHQEMITESYSHHLYIAPSVTAEDGDSEGGAPVSLIEMAATGLVVLASRHADLPDIVLDQETGLLADERDVTALRGQLHWLVRHPDQWPRLASAARKRIDAHFNAKTQGLRLAQIYGDLGDDIGSHQR